MLLELSSLIWWREEEREGRKGKGKETVLLKSLS